MAETTGTHRSDQPQTDRAAAGLLDTDLPIVAAPMAGGPGTADLARAVGAAGGFPFLAGGYLTPEAFAEALGSYRRLGTPFGVNLFVPGTGDDVDPGAFAAYAARLAPEAERYGLTLDLEPVIGDVDAWPDKLAQLLADPVPVVSLTFGLPATEDIAELRRAGSRVLATVTTPREALGARDAGVDGLVVQGPAAGGHSGTWDPARPPTKIATADLVREVVAAAGLPVIAAGGVDGAAAVRGLRDAGAVAVAVGTLLLRTDEAGTSRTHRDALTDPALGPTVITRAFTGRPARGLRNAFTERFEADAPLGYPAIHHLTRPLRRAAADAGDPDRVHLWAGTGYRNAPPGPAADVIRALARGW
ncbi:oxidoreductase [Tersicoccus solisilvae]|uniref:Propionate 3-nitronate monooxygenase n=1 Tax=Tersicoccus solisilvae TaxID=1882339 RepID=A0ABQ1PJF9_9MICC|nr:nitronate monooxygenase [Tersicoccus solisilvae]GGC98269.1 oxidoreductase [Tersicoccus solisilvae]